MTEIEKADAEILSVVLPILKRGNAVEVKLISGKIQIIEIQRKIKHRMTVTTGWPDTANRGQLI